MDLKDNKDHWYDGWIYDELVAPRLDGLYGRILEIIEPGARVIDIGCGTGRFAFLAADKCGSVVGLDLSKRNIDRADLVLSRNLNAKVSFLHKNGADALTESGAHYDYAVLSFILHEMDEAERADLLRAAARAAEKVIVGDYLVPKPGGVWGALATAVEFAAGREHYRNYLSFVRNGGIRGLAGQAGLKVVSEINSTLPMSQLVLLSK
jgi:SAM-dependent methyltransferase